jgi:hypothetical protein
MNAGKAALRREKQRIVLPLQAKKKKDDLLPCGDHFVHARAGKDGGKLIDDQ